MKCFQFLILFLACVPFSGFSQAGDLDSTFGVNGITHSYDLQNQSTLINPIIQPDGKILVIADSNGIGGAYGTGGGHALFRLLSSGQPDMTFGLNGGISFNYIEANLIANSVTGATLQPDGKIVIVGFSDYLNGPNSFFIIRFNDNGSLDTTFGNEGIDTFNNFPWPCQTGSVMALEDGKIVFSAFMNDSDALIRLLQNGQIDPGFGNNGVMPILLKASINGSGPQLARQPDGKVIVWGNVGGNINAMLGMQRLNTDWSTDLGFGTNGISQLLVGDPTVYNDNFTSISIAPNGKIVVAGNLEYWQHNYVVGEQCVLVLNINGLPDSTIGNAGVIISPFIPSTQNNVEACVCVQPDGKILFCVDGGGIRILRLNSLGSVDSSFGMSGVVLTTPDNLSPDLTGLTLQSDGKIIVTGQEGGGPPRTVVIRYLSGLNVGIINLQKSNGEAFIYPNPIHRSVTLQYSLEEAQSLSFILFDMMGRVVKTFVQEEEKEAGPHKDQLLFDELLPSGNYSLVISHGDLRMTVRLLKD